MEHQRGHPPQRSKSTVRQVPDGSTPLGILFDEASNDLGDGNAETAQSNPATLEATMSTSKPMTLAKANDLILGAFSNVPPSPELDHAVRFLSTWSGNDKFFGLVENTAKILVPLLEMLARRRYQAGSQKIPASVTAGSLKKLGALISDYRTLGRLWVVNLTGTHITSNQAPLNDREDSRTGNARLLPIRTSLLSWISRNSSHPQAATREILSLVLSRMGSLRLSPVSSPQRGLETFKET
ncbi:11193_t:CDS:2 [Acaulospora colombiana]|uniref:11193_t:CDS:1 n=1 Tax=Acaulospora colombiana TaxID=27376 RepID=A0ACA9PIX5_9GLOM|nr:11193_t:CDS:2 [Acaulospora colombiana]